MSAPKTDEAAIRATLRALKNAQHVPTFVDYGDDDGENVENATEAATIAAIMAVDDAILYVRLPAETEADGTVLEPSESFIRFVMGNEPDEVICDHGMRLAPVLDPLTERWYDAA